MRGETGGDWPGLDELLGPGDMRPGELYAPFPGKVSPSVRAAAARNGVSVSLAVSLLVEAALLLSDVDSQALEGLLDDATLKPGTARLNPAAAAYARALMSALNGRAAARADVDAVPVLPVRVGARVSSGHVPQLRPEALRQVVEWELAAVRSGRTMTEWALFVALGARS